MRQVQQEAGTPAAQRGRGAVLKLKISGYKNDSVQGLLFATPIGNHGNVRTVTGDLAERLTVKLVSGRRHKTDSRADYCPDVSDAAGGYYESKAVGRSRQVLVYGGRLEKDRTFAACNRLTYAIWRHGADTKRAATVEELQALILESLTGVYVVPFAAFTEICAALPLYRLNSGYYGNCADRPEIYGTGYRVRLSLLKDWFQVPEWLPHVKAWKEI